MNAIFLWIEETPLSVWIRESPSLLAFPGILSAHAIGMGLAAGINAAFALHVLGATPGVPSAEWRRFVPVMWLGFWLNAASGVLLLIAYPTKALTNPLFYFKLGLIAAALALFVFIRRRAFAGAAAVTPLALRLAAVASLACWAGSIAAGRLLAYTYGRLLASW
jgi:hypothetical protein